MAKQQLGQHNDQVMRSTALVTPRTEQSILPDFPDRHTTTSY